MIYRNKKTNVYYIIDIGFYNAVKDILKFSEWMQVYNYVNLNELKNIEFFKVTNKLRKL